QRLELPRLDNDAGDRQRVLRLEKHELQDGEDWGTLCGRLLATGVLNHVEHSILLADPIRKAGPSPTRLYLLRLKWSAVLARTGTGGADSTLGVAVLSGGTLRLLRIQDHLRRLGLATEFMRLLINRDAIRAVD